MNIWQKLLGSFDTVTKNAFSARKLSAFAIITMVIFTHIKWFKSDHWEYLSVVLGFDYTFILVCLGLATWQYLKQDKQNADSGNTDENKKATD